MTTNNNQQNARRFEPQYKGILTAVFNAKSAFSGAFAPIQSVDGITSNTKAFSVKTNATPVVIGTYSKDANVGFGTGTGNSSRFGNRTEVIYADTDVDFSYELAIHEGIDIATVNAGLNDAVADRLEAQSIAQTRYMNQKNGKFLSDNASKTLAMVDADSKYTEENINALFNAAAKEFTNNEIDADKTAYLVPDLYQAVVDLTNATSLKGATVSLDNNTVPKYKGFKLEETPDKYFVSGEVAYFAADQVAIPFVGIATARTIDVEAFDGKALQAHAKGGQFMLDDNKKAVLKATAPAPTAPQLATGVTLDQTTLSLKVGETATLAATVEPANTTDKTVSFASADQTIATVTPVQGKVTAVKAGTTDITVTTANGKTATCTVTVTAA